MFYGTQQWLHGGDISDCQWLYKYMDNAHEDLPAIWTVWVPAQFINFGFSPAWLRVPFVAGVSCLWTGYVRSVFLSLILSLVCDHRLP